MSDTNDYQRFRDDTLPPLTQHFRKYKNEVPFLFIDDVDVDFKVRTMTDVVSPGYHRRISNGEIINSPCSFVQKDEVIRGGTYNAVPTYGSGTYRAEGAVLAEAISRLANPFVDSLLDPAPLHADAMQKCIANIDETPYAFLEDVGEIAETLRFLKSPGRSLLKLARDSQKTYWKYQRKLKKAHQLADAVNDLYLTQRFAMTPLVRSAFDAVDAYSSDRVSRPERITARGFSFESVDQSGPIRYNYNASAYDEFDRSSIQSTLVKATILYTHGGDTGAAFKLGLRGKDIPETAWQLVPLSFMVDRVYDISGAIRGVTNLSDPRLKILCASVTERRNLEASIVYSKQVNPGWTVTVSGSGTLKQFDYIRNVWYPSYSNTAPVFTPLQLVKDAQSIADLFSLSGAILSRTFSSS
jgi:hypothetical protein